METETVRGLILSDNEKNEFWNVLVDLHMDDERGIVDQELTFGAATPPPDGDYLLMFFYKGQRCVQNGRIHQHSWPQPIVDAR
jgi:hypothetical protein